MKASDSTKCYPPKIPKYGEWTRAKYNNGTPQLEWQKERGARFGNNRKMWARMKRVNRKRNRQQTKTQEP